VKNESSDRRDRMRTREVVLTKPCVWLNEEEAVHFLLYRLSCQELSGSLGQRLLVEF
jgi:hypothetical protein